MRASRLLWPILFSAILACEPVVEPVPKGIILCEVASQCDDDNACTADVCEGGRCKFWWEEDGKSCSDEDGQAGECTGGLCH